MSSESFEQTPDLLELRLARERNEQRLKERAKRAIDASQTGQSFAGSLGISVQELWEMQVRGEVIGFSVGNIRFYPVLQARDGKIAEGVASLPEALGSDVPGLINWALKPSRFLDGQTPSDALVEGKIEAVVQAAVASNPHNRM